MLTWEMVMGGMMIALLLIYALTGGADFGGGVWDAFAFGPHAKKQRAFIAHEIGPIWEANHVWLIAIIVVFFICFPKGFAQFSTALHIPLTLMLFGIVFRGTAFVFRTYDRPEAAATWGRIFSISSMLTPIMLGMVLAATGSGNIQLADANQPATNFWSSWATPFPLAVGFLVLALFAFLAATYLAARTTDRDLQEPFRKRAMIASILIPLFAWLALLAARRDAPYFVDHLTESSWALSFQLACAMSGVIAFVCLWKRLFRRAQLAAGLQASLLILGWASYQYPYVIAPHLTIWDAAAPKNILATTFYVFLAGLVFLVPSFVYLYKVFSFQKNH